MQWKLIRLELASSGDFPRGSAGRAYLLRAPMNDDGEIDGTVLEQEPGRAIVRRHWANEADKIGYLVRTPSGVAIRYESDQNVAPGLFPIGCTSIKVGQQVVLTDLDGRELPFRVANLF
jgi:hypothetical protein